MNTLSWKKSALALAMCTALVGCGSDDGKDGANGKNGSNGASGANGSSGLNSLITHTNIGTGSHCAFGGVQVDSGIDANANKKLEASEIESTSYLCKDGFWLQLLHFADVDGNEATALASVDENVTTRLFKKYYNHNKLRKHLRNLLRKSVGDIRLIPILLIK